MPQQAALMNSIHQRLCLDARKAHPQQDRTLDGRRRMGTRLVHQRIDDLLDQVPETGMQLLVRQVLERRTGLAEIVRTFGTGH